jgi:DNA polymerase III delta subunit
VSLVGLKNFFANSGKYDTILMLKSGKNNRMERCRDLKSFFSVLRKEEFSLAVVGVALEKEDERKAVVSQIEKALFQKENIERKKISFALKDRWLEHMESLFLFQEQHLIFIDEWEVITAEQEKNFLKILPALTSYAKVVLGGKNAKMFSSSLTESFVLLDLSEEKLWDRQARLAQWVQEMAEKAGKKISKELALQLVKKQSEEWSSLEKEMEKLLCYIGVRSSIEKEDMESLCKRREVSSWELADQWVWENGAGKQLQERLKEIKYWDVSAAIGFFNQLRYVLETGLKMCDVENRGAVPAYRMKKYGSLAQERGRTFFRKALQRLYEAECFLKNYQSWSVQGVLTRLVLQIQNEKSILC